MTAQHPNLTKTPWPLLVGYVVAYDWQQVPDNIKRVYQHADSIIVSIDKDCLTWSGNKFDFDEAYFYNEIKRIDPDNKIKILRQAYYRPGHTSIENDTNQRLCVAQAHNQHGWHIQIDADEFFADFGGFVQYLRQIEKNPWLRKKPLAVQAHWVNVVKEVPGGALAEYSGGNIYNICEVATNSPKYKYARYQQRKFIRLKSPSQVVHFSWARHSEQLKQKLSNWGHNNDLLLPAESFIKIWEALDAHNYRFIKNFHYMVPESMPALAFIKANSRQQIVTNTPGIIPFAKQRQKLKRINLWTVIKRWVN